MQAVRVAGDITDAGTVQRGRWRGRVWLAELIPCSAHALPHGGGRINTTSGAVMEKLHAPRVCRRRLRWPAWVTRRLPSHHDASSNARRSRARPTGVHDTNALSWLISTLQRCGMATSANCVLRFGQDTSGHVPWEGPERRRPSLGVSGSRFVTGTKLRVVVVSQNPELASSCAAVLCWFCCGGLCELSGAPGTDRSRERAARWRRTGPSGDLVPFYCGTREQQKDSPELKSKPPQRPFTVALKLNRTRARERKSASQHTGSDILY